MEKAMSNEGWKDFVEKMEQCQNEKQDEDEENDNREKENQNDLLSERGFSFEDFKRRIGYKEEEY